MVLKLDPRHPLVWRTPESLQIGIDPPLVRLEHVSELQERMLAALAVGVSRPGLEMIGHRDEADALLRLIVQALHEPERAAEHAVAIVGTGRIVDVLGEALAGLRRDQQQPDVAVLVNDYVTPPSLHGSWLRRDIPHLPVVVTDGGVTVGPIVEPGDGPCLLCLELHRRDADPSWPAIATQLLGRAATPPPVLVWEAAALAARLVLNRLESGPATAVSTRIDAATGVRTTTGWEPHPECGCRGIDLVLTPQVGADQVSADAASTGRVSAGRRGTDWAGADPVPMPRRRTS